MTNPAGWTPAANAAATPAAAIPAPIASTAAAAGRGGSSSGVSAQPVGQAVRECARLQVDPDRRRIAFAGGRGFGPVGHLRASPSAVGPTPTPTPTPAGVEYGRASYFWNKQALPALADVNRSARGITTNCKGKLTTPCRSAIESTDKKLQVVLTVIKDGDIPACLITHVTRFKSDLLSMDGGLQIALNGYNAGDRQLVAQGLAQFRENSLPLSGDAAAVTNDVKVLCN